MSAIIASTKSLQQLREEVLEANLELVRHGLVLYTFGNASGILRGEGLIVIKPSGVPYEKMRPEHLVVTDLQGKVVEGDLRPSSDLPTHVLLYQRFQNIGGVVHTHSEHATAWAQARREIPCFGTTHADYFYGEVPVTRPLTAEEIRSAYEWETGNVIVERFTALDPLAISAVLVHGHAPFVWGPSGKKAIENAVALEIIAEMALKTFQLDPHVPAVEQHLLDKHYLRKHGAGAYYGQA